VQNRHANVGSLAQDVQRTGDPRLTLDSIFGTPRPAAVLQDALWGLRVKASSKEAVVEVLERARRRQRVLKEDAIAAEDAG
jgi:hypothetical protein